MTSSSDMIAQGAWTIFIPYFAQFFAGGAEDQTGWMPNERIFVEFKRSENFWINNKFELVKEEAKARRMRQEAKWNIKYHKQTKLTTVAKRTISPHINFIQRNN